MPAAQYIALAERFNVPQKINVHMELPTEIDRYCVLINESIRAVVDSEVSFSTQALHKPHLTLAMGYCRSEGEFWQLLALTSEFCKGESAVETAFGRPYLKEPGRNYAFVDPTAGGLVSDYKRRLDEYLSGALGPLDWDVVAEPPHITVGFVNDCRDAVSSALDSFRETASYQFTSVGVSLAGVRGTCLGTLKSFRLNG